MVRSQVSYLKDGKIEHSHMTTDAACFNEPAYSSNCRGSSGEDVFIRLSAEYEETQPIQYELTGSLLPRRKDSCMYYDMSGDKIMIIFNHCTYEATRDHRKSLPKTRPGTYEDVRKLKNTFQRLGFTVVIHDDWKYKDIMQDLADVCSMDHSNTSCVAVAVMTHGKGSLLWAADRKYPVAELTEQLRSAPSLAGKPKLFFIQACRSGHTPHKYRKKESTVFSRNADCLLLYSSYEDYYSYRDSKEGTWMMQALCKVIDEHHDSMNLVQMVTVVNRTVAQTVHPDKPVKQMPVTEYTLKKFLKF